MIFLMLIDTEEVEFRILEPTYIPEGYHEYEKNIYYDMSTHYVYENSEAEWIIWDQMRANDGLTVGVDLEFDKEEKVEINGAIASVRTYEDGRCYIYYEYEHYIIWLWADNLSTEEALKILESMEYKN